jgi:twitching motility protein PilU
VEGEFVELDSTPLNAQTIHSLCYSILTDEQRRTFEATRELNSSLSIPSIGRFRLNLFRQRGELALVARHINSSIPDFETLNLPPILADIVMEDRGLVLLVGGTGTGKSSTLAAMLAHRCKNRHGHILTIEDPIEFLHSHYEKSLINQREVGIDTESFTSALHNAMREAPNVIMIGEIRDKETMKHALAYAETGHLCLSTLHANNANQAIERILHFFPDSAHAQVLQDLSLNLRAVVSQRLIMGFEKKRVPAIEIMLNTPYISELIGAGKIENLKEAMQQATALGCKTLDHALYHLVTEKKISQEEALRHADSRTNLSLRFRLEGAESSAKEDKQLETGLSNPDKHVSYIQKLDFRIYKSFRMNCVLFKYPDTALKFLIENSLLSIISSKGLQWRPEHPDLELKFLFSSPQPIHKELALLTDENEPPILLTDSPESSVKEILIIEMYDLHLAEPVWRVRANVDLSNPAMNQNKLTTILAKLLEEFPPGS